MVIFMQRRFVGAIFCICEIAALIRQARDRLQKLLAFSLSLARETESGKTLPQFPPAVVPAGGRLHVQYTATTTHTHTDTDRALLDAAFLCSSRISNMDCSRYQLPHTFDLPFSKPGPIRICHFKLADR